MVFSQVAVAESRTRKPLLSKFLLPVVAPNAVPSDPVEFDFTDVFGPLPVQDPTEIAGNGMPVVTDLVYDEPEVICSRSHSLVGPTTCPSQTLKLSKLTLHEMDESLEFAECGTVRSFKQEEQPASDNGAQKLLDHVANDALEQLVVGLDDFEVLKVVGQGAFGKVFQVKKMCTSDIYAMKVMRKDRIMEKNHVEYMRAERDILTKIDHPFIVQLKYSFQTKYRLYLVLDFVNGGHLFFQLYRHGLFREDLARIYTAEIVSAVSHLHKNGIMHRDLKPENILLDADGHAMLTDFGLAKQFDETTRSNSMCGTLEYMAPEIVQGKGHDKAADWWSVGILLYEMLTGKDSPTKKGLKSISNAIMDWGENGRHIGLIDTEPQRSLFNANADDIAQKKGEDVPPFVGGNRQKIQQKIIKDKIKLPSFLSSEAHSLLKGLLQKEASKRLGSGQSGSEEIKRHKWFNSINWRRLENREIQPSFRPEVAGIHCTSNFEERWTNMSLSDSPASSPTANDISFKGFSYVRPAASFLQRNGSLQ